MSVDFRQIPSGSRDGSSANPSTYEAPCKGVGQILGTQISEPVVGEVQESQITNLQAGRQIRGT